MKNNKNIITGVFMQVEIKNKIPLLDKNGHITEEGWARFPYWQYKRKDIKAPVWRIKEWDYYAIISQEKKFGLTFTISDLGYIGFIAICFLDFENRYYFQDDNLIIFPMGKLNLPFSIRFLVILEEKQNLMMVK